MRFLSRTSCCFVVLAALFLPTDFSHGQVTYTITGFANNLGSPDDPLLSAAVEAGESYVANFEIDLSVEDTDPSPDRGEYPGAILSGSFEFSGGYTSQIDFAGGAIVIQRDLAGGGIFFIDPGDLSASVFADVGDPFETDALFSDIEEQFLGDPMGDPVSLFVLTEPDGLIVSYSEAPELAFGEQVRGPILFSVSLTNSVVPGDVNVDGSVTFEDIPPFIGILSTGDYMEQADLDGNEVVDFGDIYPFIAALSDSVQ